MPDTHLIPAQPVNTMQADGYVVVSSWRHARSVQVGRCFEEYAHLADAVAFFRSLGRGLWSDHEPVGIFPSLGGLPVGGALDVTNLAVVSGRPRYYGVREYQPNTPENCRARDQRRAEEIGP